MRIPFIRIPFASSGDKSSIPDATQPSGSISMQSGWGVDYEKEVGVDPAAKSVNRQDMNQVLYLATALLNKWQIETFPEWIDSAANGGSPLAYPLGSVVRYSADGIAPYVAWVNNVADNATTPSEPNGWIRFSDVAGRSRQATESIQGTMEIGTQVEVDAGTSDSVATTPKKLKFGFSFITVTGAWAIVFPSWLGGFVVQGGTVGGFNSYTVTLPVAFPTKSFGAPVAICNGPIAALASCAWAETNIVTGSQFTIACYRPGPSGGVISQDRGVSWVAFGH